LHAPVGRERLFALLDAARERPCVWIVAPPGAGKTTLVATWLEAREIPCIWYQVDPGDADLATFLHYLRTAAARASARGRSALPALTPEHRGDVAAFARRFFRQLFARMPDRAVLVLDNYQEVDPEQPFHRIVADAIGETPPGIAVIVVSRRDPPDCYARLLAAEHVAFVGWQSLRLTPEEAQQIATLRGACDPTSIRSLHEQCEGWAAGFTLLLERAARGGSVSLPSNSGASSAIFDYFAGELFDRFPGEARRLLLALSFLPRISEDAARAVTGTAAALALLEDLHRRRLFTERRATSPSVYQFHALFLAFLRARAAQALEPGEAKALTRRAAQALQREGNVEDAFPLYLRAGDYGTTRELIRTNAADLIGQGRWAAVVEWVDALPAQSVCSDCWLCFWLGAARVPVAPPRAREDLENSYALAVSAGDVLCEIQAAAGIAQTYMVEYARFRPLDPWIDALQAALGRAVRFPDADTETRVQSALLAALAYRRPDDPRIDACAASSSFCRTCANPTCD
jgi:ATP/maltotriose-dependent transcriptional regulator MalT